MVSMEMPEKMGGETTEVPSMQQEKLFDLRLLFREFWRWKWGILIGTLIGAAVGINDARKFVPIFEARMTVTQAGNKGFMAPVGGGGMFGAARSLGLVSGGTATATDFDHFKQTLGSRGLAEILQRKYGLMQKIYKGSWDAVNKTWVQPQIDENSFWWRIKKIFHYNMPQVPDLGSLAKYVGGSVIVEPIPKSPFFSISVTHRDRNFALYLLNTAYEEADGLLGERDRRKQSRDKQYLEEQLEKTQLSEVRTALLALLMQQEQQSMLVNSDPPYTIKVLEPPWVSRQPKEPELKKIIGIPAAVAFILCLVAVTIAASFRME
jgi:hypothetical protein